MVLKEMQPNQTDFQKRLTELMGKEMSCFQLRLHVKFISSSSSKIGSVKYLDGTALAPGVLLVRIRVLPN